MFELTAPYITGMLLLPLVAKARVMHTFAHIKKDSLRLAQIQNVDKKPKYDKVATED